MTERDIFLEAVEKSSPEERQAFLDRTCGADTQLRSRFERLLKSHDEGNSLLDHPILGDSQPDTLPARDHSSTRIEPASLRLDFLVPSEKPGCLGVLGQYEILEVVAHGGMGIVLKGHDTRLNRIVAIKVLSPGIATIPTAHKRFLREAKAAAAVSHDHVVTIYGVEDQPVPHLVMEFIDGCTLQQKIDKEGQLELKEVLRIGRQIAAGLVAAHEQGLIHRDIKPGNILLQNGVERVQITDFGIARATADVEITRAGEVTGTPQYMSPEQAKSQPLDHRSDLFSLGSVLYAMCSGRSPFRAETPLAAIKRVCEDEPRPLRENNPEIPEWLAAIIDKLLAKNPDDRFQSAAEVADLLGQHLAHLQDPGSTPFPGVIQAAQAKTERGGRRRWLTAAAVLLISLACLGVTEATGVTSLTTTVIRLATGQGTLVIEVDDPTVQVTLDGEELSITGAGIQELKLRPGQYQFQAIKDGEPVKRELVTIMRGGRQVVRITHEAMELGAQDEGVSNGPLEPGYISLFDGKTLNGWHDNTSAFLVENGILISSQRGNLFTDRQFSDFILQFDFRLSPGANNGIGIRAPFSGDPALNGLEIQILDDSSYGKLGDYCYHGSIWGVAAAERGYLKAIGKWNHQEVRCLGEIVQVTLNGTLILDADLSTIDDPPDGKSHPGFTRKYGHIVLMGNRGRTDFRNIQIKDLSGEEEPFVVLNSEGAEISRSDSLTEAVASSGAGDTIEISGNGPFVTDPIVITHSLMIRAGDDFRPVIERNTKSRLDSPLLDVRSPLVLEGVELKNVVPSDGDVDVDIVKATVPLRVANCRLAMLKPSGNCVWSSSSGVLRNCEIVNSEAGCNLAWTTPAKGSFIVENCVLAGMTMIHLFDGSSVSLQLNGNTILNPEASHGALGLTDHSGAKAASDGSMATRVHIVSSGCIIDSVTSVLTLFQSPDLPNQLKPDKAKAQLRRLLRWREERNVYRGRGVFLQIKTDGYTDTICDRDLGEWNWFWDLTDTGSACGIIRYKSGNLFAKVQFTPEKLTPRDFRLRPDSAGYRAGSDGKDLGADVDLVGPGEAYERWKKSPEYREWEKQTGELMRAATTDQRENGAVAEAERGKQSQAADDRATETATEDSTARQQTISDPNGT